VHRLGIVFVAVLALTAPLLAHPVPFSYIDLRVGDRVVDLTIVAHVFDLGHDLAIDPPERLVDQTFADAHSRDLVALVASRFRVSANGRPLACQPASGAEVLAERQSVAVRFTCAAAGGTGAIAIWTAMFPYDPVHQTFLNIYEGSILTTQAILDRHHDTVEYFTGTRQGVFAVVRKFVVAGIHHILIGPDHLLFLVGLLLLGGTTRRLAIVVTSFTVAHSVTLSLAALNILSPPPWIIEPAIALSIVYVGADNLLVRRGRDVRAWIAFTFGFVHGFGFASVLREMDLPRRALGWSLFSFNLGVEIGQLLVVVAVAGALAALRARSEEARRRVATVGSIVVILAGTFWFVQRVFFFRGM
jgi:hydrogenase/urease accessory protein HupE